ncbi:ankyrin repeat domain-containing protein [Luteitalea pratensis]|uniref:ankyrin repeat domain-containing protein n=1 Tax=Luteitalea pratensis TaxID=1855912 RepID=UPI0012FF7807|nr:ankyrin repeat domain-containing protein [Luteitalea pratensis]
MLPALIRPIELRPGATRELPDGTRVPSDDVYAMFEAARVGDLERVRALVADVPGLATVEYNYTPPIHFAVREGHAGIVQFLLAHGADPAYRSYPFQESLLQFAEDRGHSDVAAILRDPLSRRFPLAPGTAPLIEAARKGDLEAVRAELARDPDLAHVSNETGDTPLLQAAHKGHLDVVLALLAAGANPDATRADGTRPIHATLMPDWRSRVPEDRKAAIADALLARGVRYTMLVAALRGDITWMRQELARDRSSTFAKAAADTLANDEDTCHQRPLSAAAGRNDMEMVRLLLEHGADPNLPEEGAPRGQALFRAVLHRHEAIVPLLLAHGADPNAMVESGGTPMEHARHDPAMLALLKAHGGVVPDDERNHLERLIEANDLDALEREILANPRLATFDDASWGDGVLAGPAHSGNHALIALLIKLGARVPLMSKWAPYYYFKHEATAAFLLDHGMDPNHMNWHRLTLLHHMAAEGELGKARLLVDHGAAIDAIDEEYQSTPLGLAARRGQRILVEFLLTRGAHPQAAGASWATPLSWARRYGHGDIADVLLAAGATS